MWLLNTRDSELQWFMPENRPAYAILSHTWNDSEISFKDMRKKPEAQKSRLEFSKIRGACVQAIERGLDWIWIDSCCIDKRSSAELSEAINSMYKWYEDSEICFVYLQDLSSGACNLDPTVIDDQFSRSKWFTRGWTLQELISANSIVFFDKHWIEIGKKGWEFIDDNIELELWLRKQNDLIPPGLTILNPKLSAITKIPEAVLWDNTCLTDHSVAQRMSWMARRTTTRPEDLAYCKLIHNIFLNLLFTF
jgi:Heterokaryon incompatibility protein (HET)